MASEIGVVEKLKEYFSSRKDICFAFLFGFHAHRDVKKLISKI